MRPLQEVPRFALIDNLLVRLHVIIVMIRWTGLAPADKFCYLAGAGTHQVAQDVLRLHPLQEVPRLPLQRAPGGERQETEVDRDRDIDRDRDTSETESEVSLSLSRACGREQAGPRLALQRAPGVDTGVPRV